METYLIRFTKRLPVLIEADDEIDALCGACYDLDNLIAIRAGEYECYRVVEEQVVLSS